MEAMDTIDRYRALLEMTGAIMFIVHQPDGRIIEASQAAEQAYRYPREQLLSLTWQDLMITEEADPSTRIAKISVPLRDVAVDGEQPRKPRRVEAMHRRGDGTPFPVEVNAMTAEAREEQVSLYLITDITHRKRREHVTKLLRTLDGRILANQPVEEVLGFAAAELVRIFAIPLVWIGSQETDGSMRLLASAGPGQSYVQGVSFRWDEGSMGDVVRDGEPRTLDLTDPTLGEKFRRAQAAGLKQVLAVPLKVSEEIVGTLNLYSRDPDPFDVATIQEALSLADHIGVTLLTARQQQMIRLQATALTTAANAVVITNRDGVIEWVNPAFTVLTGYTPEEVRGKRPSILRSDSHTDLFYQQMWQTILAGEVWHGYVRNRHRDGSSYVEEMTITPVHDASGVITHFVAVKQDITERRRQEERIAYLATHDFLTGLSNRIGLNDRLEQAVKRAQRGSAAALLLLDLDNFKVVNDTVGHPAGDQLLIEIGRMMSERVRQVDSVARLGGDEFAILLEDLTPSQVYEIAELLRAALDSFRFSWGEHVFKVTASMGIAMIDRSLSAGEVVALADAALYEAKHGGKNRVALRSAADDGDQNLAASRLVARIKESIAAERYEIHYQPVASLETGEVQHVEALVRIRDEQGELIEPEQFIAKAERLGLMPAIDRYVIRQAIGYLSRKPQVQVSINLSGLTLGESDLVDYIRQILRETGVEPSRVCFEVAEQTALLDVANTEAWIRQMKALGCRIALDDFGSRFGSRSYLQALPVDYIKLDGSFTRDLDASTANRALTKAMIDLARLVGTEIIAEQVETESDARVLRALGVEYGQGYLWGRPVPERPSAK